MMPTKKLFIPLTLAAIVVFAALTSMRKADDQPEWKNLKVLPKNISKDDLDKVMDDWKGALGVRCGFCHARDAQTNKTDFASDAKPEKEMARKMMEMTGKINEKYFKPDADAKDAKDDKDMMAAVNCYTCHHGSAHPEASAKGGGEDDHDHHGPPPAATGTGTPPPPVKP